MSGSHPEPARGLARERWTGNGGARLASRLKRGLPLLLAASLVTLVIDSQGGMHDLERLGVDLDTQLRLHSAGDRVLLVTITDEDLQHGFGVKAALDPGRLATLIGALADARPAVIVVDVDTSDPRFETLRRTSGNLPVVWAREAVFSHRRGLFRAQPLPGPDGAAASTGLANQELDQDGVIRRYQLLMPAAGGPLPSLAWAAVCAFRNLDPVRSASLGQEFYIQFTDPESRFELDGSHVLALAREASWPGSRLVRNRIVVLGAAYGAQPEHPTPAGWLQGSEVVAQILDTELSGRRVRPIGAWQLGLLQVLQGVALLFLFQVMRFRTALLASLALVPVLSAVLSVGTYGSVSRWGEFAPILVVVLGSQTYEEIRAYRSRLLERATAEAKAPMPRPPRRPRFLDSDSL